MSIISKINGKYENEKYMLTVLYKNLNPVFVSSELYGLVSFNKGLNVKPVKCAIFVLLGRYFVSMKWSLSPELGFLREPSVWYKFFGNAL